MKKRGEGKIKCGKKRVKRNAKRKKGKEKGNVKSKKVGMIRNYLGCSCFSRLCQRFCLKKCLIASFICLSSPDDLDIFLSR